MRKAPLWGAALALFAACTTVTQTDQPQSTVSTATTVVTTTTLPPVDAAGGLGDRMFPDLGNAGYDAATYEVELIIDQALSELEGRASMTAVASVPLRSFVLDFVGYQVSSITVDGEEATWNRSGRDLRITPSQPIGADESFTVVTEFAGTMQSVSETEFPFPTGWQTGDGNRFLFSQPDGASGVFPVNDHPTDRANVRLAITVPAPNVVVSAGGRLPLAPGDDPTIHRFEIAEVAPYLIPLAVGPFVPVTSEDGTVTWIGDGAELPPGFDRQAEILAFMEDELGPYPFASAGSVVVDANLPVALETQTLPTYTRVSAAWGEPVIAHELAHQWFGNRITLGQWDDIWLNEGFATFMTWRWMEHDLGRDTYESEVRRAWDTVAAANAPPPDHPPGQDLFNLSVYQRGGLALVALREFVGDERFFGFLREYVAAFSDEVVTTERFLTFVLVVLGPDAEDLLIAWIQDPELPPNPLE